MLIIASFSAKALQSIPAAAGTAAAAVVECEKQ